MAAWAQREKASDNIYLRDKQWVITTINKEQIPYNLFIAFNLGPINIYHLYSYTSLKTINNNHINPIKLSKNKLVIIIIHENKLIFNM